MNNEKVENMLNLALGVPPDEREKSLELAVGYNPFDNRWDLIIRYAGDIEFLKDYDIQIVYLLNNYAIINIPEPLIDAVSEYSEIIYIEKPKSLYFAVIEGKRASCVQAVQNEYLPDSLNLYGEGIIIAIIDSGIDYNNKVFKNADGSTRILEIWDQTTTDGLPPEGYNIGTLYTREQINEALNVQTAQARYKILPSRDLSGHGTHVAGIAAGNFAEDLNRNLGMATRSELIVVKLGTPAAGSFPRTSELMQAIDYVIKRGVYYNRPVAINLSFGNSYGAHDGRSLVSTFIDNVSNIGRNAIAAGSGNEGLGVGHARAYLQNRPVNIELSVDNYESNMNLQIWKSYNDDFDIVLISPSGYRIGPLLRESVALKYVADRTEVFVYYGEPSPYSQSQEIYIDFIPVDIYINSGIWTLELVPKKIIDGQVDMWLPGVSTVNDRTGFLEVSPETTLTVPSTTYSVISVGAYDTATDSYANFSGRGFTRTSDSIKPDIVAPGVNIRSAAVGGGYDIRTGTSMATPFVTGGVALLMEWGIVLGNDPFLYGEKAKAYLIRGARQLPGYDVWPNEMLGWGALCVADSIPR